MAQVDVAGSGIADMTSDQRPANYYEQAALMRLAWCDKIAVIWGGSLLLIGACVWRGTWIFWDADGPPFWFGTWEVGWRVVGIPWLILRLVDVVFGGPARRRLI